AGPDPNPFVGDRRIAGAYRIDGDKFGAALAQARQRYFDRVGIMILGNPEHHEEPRVQPVRLAELPKAAAERVHSGGRHVDRAEPAMCGEIRGSELSSPIAGQGLALITAGEKGELLGILAADCRQPFDRSRDRFLPFNFAKLAGPAFAHSLERLSQLCRRMLLHDAGSALAANHAAVNRVIAVAFDIADGAVFEMNFDPASAGAHVAGRIFDLVRNLWRRIQLFPAREKIAHALAEFHLIPRWASSRATPIPRSLQNKMGRS